MTLEAQVLSKETACVFFCAPRSAQVSDFFENPPPISARSIPEPNRIRQIEQIDQALPIGPPTAAPTAAPSWNRSYAIALDRSHYKTFHHGLYLPVDLARRDLHDDRSPVHFQLHRLSPTT